jgi:hypothetical protein
MSKKGKSGKPSGPVNTKAIPQKQISVPRPAPAPVAVPQDAAPVAVTGITTFRITLTILSPFLFPGISAGRFGVDRVGLRDRNGHLVIPQDQIRGVLRDALDRLDNRKINTDFGQSSADARDWQDGNFAPARGRLHFSDLVCTKTSANTTFAHRVKIDPDSGAADEGHLMVIELPFPPGETATFSGEVTFAGPASDAQRVGADLDAALRVPLSIGALKSVGFGRIERASCIKVDRPGKRVPLPSGTDLLWRFSVDRPYLVNARRVADNAFYGQIDIPGAALKGALAQTLAAQGHDITSPDIASYLSGMVIGMGRPSGSRPAMTRSIVYDDAPPGRFVNLVVAGEVPEKPSLPLDWKDNERQAAMKAGFLGEGERGNEERVHTKINSKTGGAEDEKLVSTIAVYPKSKDKTPSHGQSQMTARLRLPEGQSMPAPIKAALETFILPLGRTGAIVTTEGFSADDRRWKIAPGRIAVRLLTDGLLADPYEDGGNGDTPAEPTTAYRTFWNRLLPGSDLVDHFASQTLIGGYQARRFSPTGGYRPWVLTEAGSVFVFDLRADDLPALQHVLSHGLCRHSLGGVALTWQNCPFVAENGYGEVALYTPNEKDQATW